MERRAENIIRGIAHTSTRREYSEREKRISAVINDRENCSNLSFLKGIAHKIKF
jgi:hypothetical protein